MKHRTRVPLVLALVMLLAGSFPKLAIAEEYDDGGEGKANCTTDYMRCIAANGDLPSPLLEMADVECFADYLGCTARKLRFW